MNISKKKTQDVKAVPARYRCKTGTEKSIERVERRMSFLLGSGTLGEPLDRYEYDNLEIHLRKLYEYKGSRYHGINI